MHYFDLKARISNNKQYSTDETGGRKLVLLQIVNQKFSKLYLKILFSHFIFVLKFSPNVEIVFQKWASLW